MILITHAFSRHNAGDGLLVDLTLERLARLGYPDSSTALVALDPESFADHPHVIRSPGDPNPVLSKRVIRSGLERFGLTKPDPELLDAFDHAQAVIAVGGGYLHTRGMVEAGGCFINHLGQLDLAVRAGVPVAYLPQSIGPLPGPVGAMVRRRLGRVDMVAVRDDESLEELQHEVAARRVPDLAVLELCRESGRVSTLKHGTEVIVVGRGLKTPGNYERSFLEMTQGFDSPLIGVQSDVSEAKSDRRFYTGLGLRPDGRLLEMLSALSGGVVVSVRLHGALQAIMAGWPAIHLSYDRKGWGAYRDLGLDAFVHDARDFDPAAIISQAALLVDDPMPYWTRVQAALAAIAEQDADLDTRLSALIR